MVIAGVQDDHIYDEFRREWSGLLDQCASRSQHYLLYSLRRELPQAEYRRNARYGLRWVRMGEASHPRPVSNNRCHNSVSESSS